ncbi:MAG: hypothetical protein WBM62_17440 [Crocosphaera sp.]
MAQQKTLALGLISRKRSQILLLIYGATENPSTRVNIEKAIALSRKIF